jgi:hypothetical protein
MIRTIQQRLQFGLRSSILATPVFFFLLVLSVEAQMKAKPFASEVRSTIQDAQKEGSVNLSWVRRQWEA